MNSNEILIQKIWNGEKTERPAIIVDEIDLFPVLDNPDNIENICDERIKSYNCLKKGRDDNIPAISTCIGTFVIASLFGTPIRNDEIRYVEKPIIQTSKDVDDLKPVDIAETYAKLQLEMLKRLADYSKGDIPIRIPDIQSPLGTLEMMWETNDFYTSLVDEPNAVHKALDIITETTIKFAEDVYEIVPNLVPVTWPKIWAPKDKGIYIADDTMSLLSPEMYGEYCIPYNNIISRSFGGVFLHSCSTKKAYFEKIIQIEGLRSINFAAAYSSEMNEIFEYFGDKIVVIPHYCHGDSLQIGTVHEFLSVVRDCWKREYGTIIYISAAQNGGLQEDVLKTYRRLFS